MTIEKTDDPRFWDRYLEVLKHAAVPERNWRWFVKDIERLIDTYPSQLLPALDANAVFNFLSQRGRNPDVKGWQFRQTVQALQLLFSSN